MFGTYSASKAAANAVTVAFAADLEAAGIKVNAACPGFTGTDLNFFRGARTVEEGAREPVRLALIGPTDRPARSPTKTAHSRGDHPAH
jgi:NAD(P)-dependent dehydrogenase (short-subunit alcohol dehydrogenase family)